MTNEDRKNQIELSRKIINDEYKKLNKLVESCKHEYEQSYYESARCCICNKDGGWWCPSEQSEDHLCKYEDGECCIYCGEPEERQ